MEALDLCKSSKSASGITELAVALVEAGLSPAGMVRVPTN